jgi:hypothetical protein
MRKTRFCETTRRRWFEASLAATMIGAIAGCGSGDGLNRQAVTGIVTCDGKLIPAGAILFEPETYQSGTTVGGTVRKGSFTIAERDGPVPGTYKVRIYMSSGVQAAPAEGQSGRSPRPMVEFLPEQYNAKTELRAEVRDGGANRFRFDLRSDPRSGTR